MNKIYGHEMALKAAAAFRLDVGLILPTAADNVSIWLMGQPTMCWMQC